jgi:hypothetical protein
MNWVACQYALGCVLGLSGSLVVGCDANQTREGILTDAGVDTVAATDTTPPCTDETCGDAFAEDVDTGTHDVRDTNVSTDVMAEVSDDVAPPPPECVNVRLTCHVRGTSFSSSETLTAEQLSTIDCLATSVFDDVPDGLTYRWSLEKPVSSSASWQTVDGRENAFFVDSAGEYRARVEADLDGEALSCAPAEVLITSRYGEALVVELTWVTPGDPDRDDTGAGAGADLDLHFLRRGRSCWNDEINDCHWRNKEPDWGVFGDVSDDPRLSVEDTDGWGPELVRLNKGENTTYSVGVEYWDDWTFGPSTARVRIYLLGELVLEEERVLEGEKDFWHVADIDWSTLQVVLVDEEYRAIGEAECTE